MIFLRLRKFWAKRKIFTAGKYIEKWKDWVPNKGLLNLDLLISSRIFSHVLQYDWIPLRYSIVQVVDIGCIHWFSGLQCQIKLIFLRMSSIVVLISTCNSTMQCLPIICMHTNAQQKTVIGLCQIMVLCCVKVIRQVTNDSFKQGAVYTHTYVHTHIYTHMCM